MVASPGLREQAAPLFTLGGANAGRTAIYRANLDIVHDHPLLGLGYGWYKAAANPYYDRFPEADRRSHAHSNVLQVAAEGGLVGADGVLPAVRGDPAAGIRRARDGRRPVRSGRPTAGAWVGIATFLFAGLTQYSFGDAEVVISMWLAAAVLMRCAEPA